jgi:hypothetical protein
MIDRNWIETDGGGPNQGVSGGRLFHSRISFSSKLPKTIVFV